MIKNSEYPNSAVEFNLKETQYALDMSIYVPASCSFVDVKSMWAATFVCTESNDVIMEKENEILEQYYEKIIINEKIYYYDFEKKYKISEIEVKKGKFINYLIFVFTRV